MRNHELRSTEAGFGDPAGAYDPAAAGGTTTVVVDDEGNTLDGWVSLNGSQYNCAGGRTPWGSWLTCEESINGPDVGNDFQGGDNALLTQTHGYVLEAAAVDPVFGDLSLTEDSFLTASGFYRYRPPVHCRARDPSSTAAGCSCKVRGIDDADLWIGLDIGATSDVDWVDIDDPDPSYGGISNDAAVPVVGDQGRARVRRSSAGSRVATTTWDGSPSPPPRVARPSTTAAGSGRGAARSSPTTRSVASSRSSTSR